MNLSLLPLHTGVWEGTYTRIAPDGTVVHRHDSRLTLRLDGNEWRQTNLYLFDNGRTEFHNFGASPIGEDGVMRYDNPRIVGAAWEEPIGGTIQLWWSYKNEPGTMLHEMIKMLEPDHRMRVWQHSRNGRFEGITMIEERRVASMEDIPMEHYDQNSYVKEG
jgi:Domain of unknown function (DUF3598)